MFSEGNHVAVLISTAYGHGWSTTVSNIEQKKIMMLNETLVKYVLDCRKNDRAPLAKKMRELWTSNFPEYPVPELRGVEGLAVFWIEKGSSFQVKDMNGAEYIYFPSDDNNWITV